MGKSQTRTDLLDEISKILKGEAQPLRNLEKDVALGNLISGIGLILTSHKIEQSKRLTPQETEFIANEVLHDKYGNMSLLEWLYFVQEAGKGTWGKLYGVLTQPTLFILLEEYWKERALLIQRARNMEEYKRRQQEDKDWNELSEKDKGSGKWLKLLMEEIDQINEKKKDPKNMKEKLNDPAYQKFRDKFLKDRKKQT